MTGGIEIKGYTPLVPNIAWSKNIWQSSERGFAREVVVAHTYSSPAQADVLTLIQRAAKDFNAGKYDAVKTGNQIVVDESALRVFLQEFTPEELKDMASGNQDAVAHLTEHYPKTSRKEGARYLQVATGIVPEEAFETMPADIKAALPQLGWKVYTLLLDKIGKDAVSIRVALDYNYRLPLASKIEGLLEEEVVQSRTLSVNSPTVNYQAVEDKIWFIYAAFGSAENARKLETLRDTTEAVKVSAAAQTLDGTLKCLEARSTPRIMVVDAQVDEKGVEELLKKIMSGKKGRIQ